VTSRIVEVGSGSHNNTSPGSLMLGTGCLGQRSQPRVCYVFPVTHCITTLSFHTTASVSVVGYRIWCHVITCPTRHVLHPHHFLSLSGLSTRTTVRKMLLKLILSYFILNIFYLERERLSAQKSKFIRLLHVYLN
jgi:hypothetical protein